MDIYLALFAFYCILKSLENRKTKAAHEIRQRRWFNVGRTFTSSHLHQGVGQSDIMSETLE